jgi:hypothetical protein
MPEESLRYVERDSTEVQNEEWNPFYVCQEILEEVLFSQAMAKDRKSNIAEAGEDAHDREVDFETVDVVVIKNALEPPYKEVVPKCKYPGGAESVVCADVGNNGQFRWQWHT